MRVQDEDALSYFVHPDRRALPPDAVKVPAVTIERVAIHAST